MSVSPRSLEGGAPAGQPAGVMDRTATGAKYALFLLFAINLLNFFDRQLLGALGEPVRHEFALSDTALGFLGTIFTIIYDTRDEIVEVLLQTAVYVGVPAANTAFGIANRVLAEPVPEGDE